VSKKAVVESLKITNTQHLTPKTFLHNDKIAQKMAKNDNKYLKTNELLCEIFTIKQNLNDEYNN
jgi:hypothetical protein